MKKLLVLGLMLGLQAQAQLAFKETVRVVSDETHDLNIPLNATSVKCLVGDYGASSLKIVVPELQYLTQLDHTSRGAAGPCINAGFCDGAFQFPATDSRLPILISAANPTENIKLRVRMLEIFTADPNSNICSHIYKEEVLAMIRGIPFTHEKAIGLSQVDIKDCK